MIYSASFYDKFNIKKRRKDLYIHIYDILKVEAKFPYLK